MCRRDMCGGAGAIPGSLRGWGQAAGGGCPNGACSSGSRRATRTRQGGRGLGVGRGKVCDAAQIRGQALPKKQLQKSFLSRSRDVTPRQLSTVPGPARSVGEREGPARLPRRVVDGRHERRRPARFPERRRAETPGPETNSEAAPASRSNSVCAPLVVSSSPPPAKRRGTKSQLLAVGRPRRVASKGSSNRFTGVRCPLNVGSFCRGWL